MKIEKTENKQKEAGVDPFKKETGADRLNKEGYLQTSVTKFDDFWKLSRRQIFLLK